jgi:diguanylate cyclase (GGDEF)-like protein
MMSVSEMILAGVLTALLALATALAAGCMRRARGQLIAERDRCQEGVARERADRALLADETARLKKTLDAIVLLFEVTRGLTSSIERQGVVGAFRETMTRYLPLEDCRFAAAGEAGAPVDEQTSRFPLYVAREPIGELLVRGLREKDQETFSVLAGQFALAMKRVFLYQRLQELATTDSLTNTFSRRYWFSRAAEELERSGRFGRHASCLMIDIDRFKELNDTYGHLTGDTLVVAVARIARENIRSVDLLGRYGGEEFCVLLSETEPGEAAYVAGRIRQAVQEARIWAYDESLSVTVSIGVAGSGAGQAGLAELVDRADRALYRAKEEGRNRVCVSGG